MFRITLRRFVCFLAFFLLLLSAQAFAAEGMSPVGTWQTIDDKTHKPRSIIQIWDENGALSGKIVKIFFREGEKSTDTCHKCTDPEHKNQPILGMKILWGMQQKKEALWNEGHILDPQSGKIYHCQLMLSPNGRHLKVRGYVAIPLIGRSQNWVRVG